MQKTQPSVLGKRKCPRGFLWPWDVNTKIPPRWAKTRQYLTRMVKLYKLTPHRTPLYISSRATFQINPPISSNRYGNTSSSRCKLENNQNFFQAMKPMYGRSSFSRIGHKGEHMSKYEGWSKGEWTYNINEETVLLIAN